MTHSAGTDLTTDLTSVGVILTALAALRNGWRLNDVKKAGEARGNQIDEVHSAVVPDSPPEAD